MTVLLIMIYLGLVCVSLVLLAPEQPQDEISDYELHRRLALSDTAATRIARTRTYAADVRALRYLGLAACASGLTIVGISLFAWPVATLVLLGTLVSAPWLSRRAAMRRLSSRFRVSQERMIEQYYTSIRPLLRMIAPEDTERAARRFGSREELVYQLTQATDIISPQERHELEAVLSIAGLRVKDIFIPRKELVTIDAKELLGPLVLHELHSHGHARIPVMAGDDDRIVGILHLRSLLTLDTKRSLTAARAMSEQLYYVREDDSLENALSVCLQTEQLLLLVVSRDGAVTGAITLKDILFHMRGHNPRHVVPADTIHAAVHGSHET